MKTLIFGGAFDPPTIAHKEIFRCAVEWINTFFPNDFQVKVLISCNDEKTYKASFEHRSKMAEAAFDGLSPVKFQTLQQDARMYEFITKKLEIELDDAYVVIGLDQAQNILNGQWHNSENLMKGVHFLVADRSGGKLEFVQKKWVEKGGIPLVLLSLSPVVKHIASSRIRAEFLKEPFVAEDQKALVQTLGLEDKTREYIIKNHLYFQYDHATYAEEFHAFLKEYKAHTLPGVAKFIAEQHKVLTPDVIYKKITEAWTEPSCTVDLIIMNEEEEVLLIRRGNFPFAGYWALPGGFFEHDNDGCLEETAKRELAEETGLVKQEKEIQQFKVYSHCFDPRLRIVDTVFFVRVSSEEESMVAAGDDAADAHWFPAYDLPKLGFHHKQAIDEFLRSDLNPFKK